MSKAQKRKRKTAWKNYPRLINGQIYGQAGLKARDINEKLAVFARMTTLRKCGRIVEANEIAENSRLRLKELSLRKYNLEVLMSSFDEMMAFIDKASNEMTDSQSSTMYMLATMITILQLNDSEIEAFLTSNDERHLKNIVLNKLRTLRLNNSDQINFMNKFEVFKTRCESFLGGLQGYSNEVNSLRANGTNVSYYNDCVEMVSQKITLSNAIIKAIKES